MEEIAKYCNENDVVAWLTVLKAFELDRKAALAKQPFKRVPNLYAEEWTGILVACFKEY